MKEKTVNASIRAALMGSSAKQEMCVQVETGQKYESLSADRNWNGKLDEFLTFRPLLNI